MKHLLENYSLILIKIPTLKKVFKVRKVIYKINNSKWDCIKRVLAFDFFFRCLNETRSFKKYLTVSKWYLGEYQHPVLFGANINRGEKIFSHVCQKKLAKNVKGICRNWDFLSRKEKVFYWFKSYNDPSSPSLMGNSYKQMSLTQN